MDAQKPEPARLQLDAIREAVSSKIGTVYCSNLIAGAVMVDKSAACQENQIALDINVALPESLSMNEAEICSIFSNILGNAIEACQKCEAGNRRIDLRAYLLAGCLIVDCKNTAMPEQPQVKRPQNDLIPLRGLGLEILETLADRHNGSLKTYYEDGFFHLSLIAALPAALERVRKMAAV